jgi:hypothetical protein
LTLSLFLIGFISAWNFEQEGGSTVTVSTSTTTLTGNLTNFTELQDTPDSYSGNANKCVIVNAGATALVFGDCSSASGDITSVQGDNVYIYNGSDSGAVVLAFNITKLIQNIGNWSSDKPSYYTSSQTDTQIANANTSVVNWANSKFFFNITNFTGTLTNAKYCVYNGTSGEIDCNSDATGSETDPLWAGNYSLVVFTSQTINWDKDVSNDFTNISNFTSSKTDGKLCFYNVTLDKFDCTYTDLTGSGGNTTEEMQDAVGSGFIGNLSYDDASNKFDINSVNLLSWLDNIYVRISNLVSLVGNWSADKTNYGNWSNSTLTFQEDIGSDCSAGDFVKGVDDSGVLDCSTPSGAGDITGINTTLDNYLYNGSDSGNVYLRFNDTKLNATIDARDDDTNETTRFNVLVGTDCSAGDFVIGVQSNGLLLCTTPTSSNPFNQVLNTTSNVTFSNLNITNLIRAGNWSNVTITESQISDFGTYIESETDPKWASNQTNYYNKTDVQNNFVNRTNWTTHDNYPTGCSAGEAVRVIGDTLTCITLPIDTDTQKSGGAPYLYNDSTTIYVNDTVLNNTIDSLDSDTTYTNGSGLSLVGTQFNHTDTSSQSSSDNSGNTFIQDVVLDAFGHITSLVTATASLVLGTGDVNTTHILDGTIRDVDINLTNVTVSDFTNDVGYITTDTNETSRFNNLTGTDCSGTNKVIGVQNNGTILCEIDVDTNTYNTTEEMQDAVGSALDSNFTYNDAGNTITVDGNDLSTYLRNFYDSIYRLASSLIGNADISANAINTTQIIDSTILPGDFDSAVNTSLDTRYVNIGGDTMTGNLNMSTNNITMTNGTGGAYVCLNQACASYIRNNGTGVIIVGG